MTRDELVRLIGSSIDYPNVYMGGASYQSMRKAERILEALAASGFAVVPVEATCEMVNAAPARHQPREDETMYSSIWRAMIAAAQDDGK